MALYDSSWKYCTETGIVTGEYIIFYQGRTIEHATYVTVPFSQSSVESEYNAARTSGMALEHFRMLINEWLNKDPGIVP